MVKLHINDMWIGLNRWHIASPLVTSVLTEIAFKNKNCRKGYFIQMIDMINCIFCTFDCLHSLKIRTIQKKLILTTIRKHLKHWCFHYWHKSTNDQSLLIKVNHFLFLTSKSKVIKHRKLISAKLRYKVIGATNWKILRFLLK